jgi:hypothetical protein
MVQKSGLLFSLSLFLMYFSMSCSKENIEKTPDISNISIDFKVRRFEKELFQADTLNFNKELAQIKEKDTEFAEIYFNQILGSNDLQIAPQGEEKYLIGFTHYKEVQKLYDTIQNIYAIFDPIESDFKTAFKYFKYYFPEKPTPKVTTFISEFSLGNFIYGENNLAVGLDFYLGSNFPYQQKNPQNPNFSAYLTRSFNADHLVSKTLQPLVDDLIPPPETDHLLALMIREGKKLYVQDKLLPATNDSIIMEVSTQQWDWLVENEKEIFSFFLQESLFYDSNWQKIRKYVEYSPNSPGMPIEAPGRTGAWLGWQIVKALMKKNPSLTLTEMIQRVDSKQFLTDSGYKPPRK